MLCYGGSLLALLFLLALYSRYALDFPYADQWDFVPTLDRALNGQLAWRDLWAQHNEHRLIFPRLLMLALAVPSHWNIHWELAANVVLAVQLWMVLCLQARASGKMLYKESNEPVYLLFALLVFSLSQWGNWFLGWQLQEFMNALAAAIALCALCWRRFPILGMVVAACFGIVATYSFANGLLIWPIGLFLLWLQRADRAPHLRDQYIAWCGVSVAVIAAYLAGYEAPPHHTSLLRALGQPVQCVLYALAYLGQPVGQAADLLSIVLEILGLGSGPGAGALSILMGILGLLLWAVTLAQLHFSEVPSRSLLPWVGLAAYALGTAALTALGRVDDGVEQALSSRYVTMANFLWFAIAAQSYWAGRVVEGSLTRRALPVKVGVLCAALLVASLAGAYRWTERFHAYSALRSELLHGDDVDALRPLYPPDPALILERRPLLEAQGLGIFKVHATPPPESGDDEQAGPR